jgi:hypothetical protein
MRHFGGWWLVAQEQGTLCSAAKDGTPVGRPASPTHRPVLWAGAKSGLTNAIMPVRAETIWDRLCRFEPPMLLFSRAAIILLLTLLPLEFDATTSAAPGGEWSAAHRAGQSSGLGIFADEMVSRAPDSLVRVAEPLPGTSRVFRPA